MAAPPKQFNFTKRGLENLPAQSRDSAAREAEYSDTECVGLKCLVNRQGRKFFYFRYSLNKRRRAIKVGEFPSMSLAEARQQANALRSLVDRGIDPQAAKQKARAVPTLKQFSIDLYLPHVEDTKRSAKDDRSRLVHHLLPRFGKLSMSDITPQMIQRFLSETVKRGLAPATANRLRSLLHHIFSLAVQWDAAPRNPVHGVPKFQENNQRQRFLNKDEIRALEQALAEEPNVQAADFIRLLLMTGARVGELLNSKYADLDLDGGVWRIPRSKSGKSRIVILNEVAKALFARQIPRMGNPYVFPGSLKYGNERMVSPQHAFERIKRRAGLENLRLHDLRHSFASLAVGGGASLYDVQTLLGHGSHNMTQRYAHLADERLRHVSNGVADAVAQALDGMEEIV